MSTVMWRLDPVRCQVSARCHRACELKPWNSSFSELNPLYESKLSLMEEYCRKAGRKANELSMQLFRQFSLNLRREDCAEPTAFAGPAFDEETNLRGIPDQIRSYVSFDIFTFRLVLAVIFWDEALMAEMLEKLRVMPTCFNDMSTARTHVRLTYMALAAFGLKRKELGEQVRSANTRQLCSTSRQPRLIVTSPGSAWTTSRDWRSSVPSTRSR